MESKFDITQERLRAGIRRRSKSGRALYDERAVNAITWLIRYAEANKLSRQRVCELLEYDWTTITRIVDGSYPASPEELVGRIEDLKRRAESTVSAASDCAPTLVSRRIWDTLDYAQRGDLSGGRIVSICGPTGRGKTISVRDWVRRHHGAVFVDCPVGGRAPLIREIARRCGVARSGTGRLDDLADGIAEAFSRHRMLVIDEVARLMPRSRTLPMGLEFLRRLHDVTRCPIAIIGTELVTMSLTAGAYRDYLEQLLGRIVEPLEIPSRVYKSEITEICTAYATGHNPSPELAALALAIANRSGKLRLLTELLAQAALLARRRGEDLDSIHLDAAIERRRSRYDWPRED